MTCREKRRRNRKRSWWEKEKEIAVRRRTWHEENRNPKQTLLGSIPSFPSLFAYKIAGNRDNKTGCRLRFDSEPKEKQRTRELEIFPEPESTRDSITTRELKIPRLMCLVRNPKIYTFMRMNTEARIFHFLRWTFLSFFLSFESTRELTESSHFFVVYVEFGSFS